VDGHQGFADRVARGGLAADSWCSVTIARTLRIPTVKVHSKKARCDVAERTAFALPPEHGVEDERGADLGDDQGELQNHSEGDPVSSPPVNG
jgi:hypothetical protein